MHFVPRVEEAVMRSYSGWLMDLISRMMEDEEKGVLEND